ncbi:MAG TPA: hypothetical protein VGQ53_10490 [Chitinophagaceae bacterium]|jgi:fluoride ion exporter CrcB/FEX|nr:hypothetical protein [Chitinophagaceae bacterium]
MIINYLKIASRNLWRHVVFSSINIAGLSVGMTACFLIFFFARFDLSNDSFHSKDRILVATGILATLAAIYTISFWISRAWRGESRKILSSDWLKKRL